MQGPRLDLSRIVPEFDRRFFESQEEFTLIGSGALGGEALGLARIKRLLEGSWRADRHVGFTVRIPRLTVIGADVFAQFVEENRLAGAAEAGETDEGIARSFLKGSLPVPVVGDLRGLIERVCRPLAVRSSSLLEDQAERPFAGIYATKMIPNNQHDAESRFQRLVEAVKFVYASTFFAAARDYRAGLPDARSEQMAVILQEVVGRRHGDRFYPDLSGVARSWNFYAAGGARPDEGTASLALGLGKTIVDGGVVWSYSPARPRANPPFGSARDLLGATQTRFWAVNMGPPPAYDPVAETEYLVRGGLAEAEADDVLGPLVSTYDAASDRLRPGAAASGPRALTFAPILVDGQPALNDVIRDMLELAEAAGDGPMEIEFAVAMEENQPVQVGFLQARPLRVESEAVPLAPEALRAPGVVVASESVLGHGRIGNVADLVIVRRDRFEPAKTREIAREIAAMNRDLQVEGRPYALIGFGRWGSADPWLGVPVTWGQISGARAIVEASLPGADPDPSQGSHFFHNVMSAGVAYFTVRHTGPYAIDWQWLDTHPAAAETEHVRRVRLAAPVRIEVDGWTGRGVIRR